jgi:hypothetical protein
MDSLDFTGILAVYFIFILVFGDSNYRVHSFIIVLSSVLNLTFQLPVSTGAESYVFNRNVFVLWDGATAFILTMFLIFDRIAWKQALLLSFACFCHIMIVYDLTVESTWFSLFFYSYYNELIVLTGVAQMVVSHNGIYTALRAIRKFIRGRNIDSWSCNSCNYLFVGQESEKCGTR